MSTRTDFRAITRTAVPAASGAAPVFFKICCTILGGLLLLSAP